MPQPVALIFRQLTPTANGRPAWGTLTGSTSCCASMCPHNGQSQNLHGMFTSLWPYSQKIRLVHTNRSRRDCIEIDSIIQYLSHELSFSILIMALIKGPLSCLYGQNERTYSKDQWRLTSNVNVIPLICNCRGEKNLVTTMLNIVKNNVMDQHL